MGEVVEEAEEDSLNMETLAPVADLLEERDLQDLELLLHHQEDHTPLHLTATAAQDLQQLQHTHSLKNLEAMDLVHPLLTVDMELQADQPVLVMELLPTLAGGGMPDSCLHQRPLSSNQRQFTEEL